MEYKCSDPRWKEHNWGQEEWRPFHEVTNKLYYASNIGRVLSVSKITGDETICQTETLVGRGSYRVSKFFSKVPITMFGGKTSVYVSVIVATLFLPNPLKKKYVIHKDSNVLNNIITNLEWSDTPGRKRRK